MAVFRNRSTNTAPVTLSTSYLTGSPRKGISTTTFTSRGGSAPAPILSRLIAYDPYFPRKRSRARRQWACAAAWRSTLLPRQSFKTPAIHSAAMMLRIDLTFEAVRDIVNVLKTIHEQSLRRRERPHAAAADQQDRYRLRRLSGTERPQGVPHLPREIRIDPPVRLIHPRHVRRAGGVSDEEIFSARTDINQHGVLPVLQDRQ